MDDEIDIVSAQDRVALLREGIVVLSEEDDARGRRVYVSGLDEGRVREAVAARVGRAVDVWVCGEMPRQLRPLPCAGYVEEVPAVLALRFLLHGEQHLDDAVICEDDEAVVVFGMLCASVFADGDEARETAAEVLLDQPLGDRQVIDGCTGNPVPQRDFVEELRDKWRTKA